jgi:hypothetical protein
MKKLLFSLLLALTFCLPSAGQIREIYDDGYVDVSYNSGLYIRLADAMYAYRMNYGRYPDNKAILLDYFLDIAKEEYDFYVPQNILGFPTGNKETAKTLARRNKELTADLKNPENTLVVSGDTCTFTYAHTTREITFYGIDDSMPPVVRKLKAVQCIGGAEELQKTESEIFRTWIFSRFYDKNGKMIYRKESPFVRDINLPFRYVVAMESRTAGEPEFPMFGHILFPLVFVPVTMTRGGNFSIDTSCLDGIQLYYRERTSDPDSVIGTITLEEAMDQDRIKAMKAYLTDFLSKHKEVYTIKLWEVLCFNLKENDGAQE